MTAGASDWSWIAELCSTDVTRSNLMKPFWDTHEGKAYTIATDGHRMIAIDGQLPDTAAARVPALTLAFPKKKPDARASVDLGRLRAWASVGWLGCKGADCELCRGKRTVACDECGGTGSRDRTCDNCDEIHECVCMECEDGTHECTGRAGGERAPMRRGWLGRGLFDLDLLAPTIGRQTDADVRVEFRGYELLIIGAGWRAVIMGIRPGAEDDKWPRFELGAVAA